MKFQQQPRVKGQKRKQVSTRVLHKIEAALRADMRRYGVSRSFVIANALGYVYNVSEQQTVSYARPRRLRLVS